MTDIFKPLYWSDDCLQLLDQRLLPEQERYLSLDDPEQVIAAIVDMQVRGAPAIGLAAAYGVVLAARKYQQKNPGNWRTDIEPYLQRLHAARPTAVNLAWAVERMRSRIETLTAESDPEPPLLEQAQLMQAQDIQANLAMGQHGAELIEPGSGVITHCNAGALATGGYGTALGVIRAASSARKLSRVYADETRPWLQGSRLTAWELLRDGIAVELLADSAAAWRMAQGGIDWVIVGADRVVANGDAANKIGTYALMLAARAHGVKTMVVAPVSTVDMDTPDGSAIEIEERDPAELLGVAGKAVAAPGAGAWNPVFDVTPAHLIDYFVCEKGALHHPGDGGLEALVTG